MNDLISRQAAIKAIKEDKIDLTNPNIVAVFKATGDFEKVQTQVMTCDRHIGILKELPSERKHGKWDFIGYNQFKCTNCETIYTDEQFESMKSGENDPYAPNFCPHCGADMREVDDGQV